MKFVLLSMLSIVLLGTGNVAHHLFDAFTQLDGVLVKQVYGRSPKSLKFLLWYPQKKAWLRIPLETFRLMRYKQTEKVFFIPYKLLQSFRK